MTHRLNKLISDSGLCSRREADRFIETGRVTVNGAVAQLGAFVQEDDKVLVDGFPINLKAVAIRVAKGKQQNAQSTSTNKLSHKAKSIIAQQMASAPKSAALRKTSKNNPANRPQVEEEEETPFVPYRKFYRKDESQKTPGKFRDSKAAGTPGKPRDTKSASASGKPRDTKGPGAPNKFRDSKAAGAPGKPWGTKSASASGKPRNAKPTGVHSKPEVSKVPNRTPRRTPR